MLPSIVTWQVNGSGTCVIGGIGSAVKLSLNPSFAGAAETPAMTRAAQREIVRSNVRTSIDPPPYLPSLMVTPAPGILTSGHDDSGPRTIRGLCEEAPPLFA